MKITHAVWMKDTAAMGRSRSTELKQVDSALLAYETALEKSSGSVLNERRALQQALEAWKAAQKAKGQDWRTSVRNKQKTVELLDAEMGLVIGGAGGLNSRGELMLDPEEVQAAKALADAIKQNTRQMFTGKKLALKNSKGLADLNEVRSALSAFKSTANQVRQAASGAVQPGLNQQLQSTLVSLFGDATASQVQEALGPIFAEFLTAATPFVGAIKSGASAIVKWGQAAKGLWAKHKMGDASASFAPGDPAAAFASILVIQQREVNSYATSASIYTVSAGAKAAFTAVDFGALSGPLLGAAESLALLVQKIYLYARDWTEMKDANALLQQGACDLNLFKTCPLLGCYLIANSDTSHVINMAVGDYGKPGWKFEVEAMVSKAQPVFEKARSVILDARYEIPEMRGMKGTVVNRTAKTLGIPTGKISGLMHDVSSKIDSLTS